MEQFQVLNFNKWPGKISYASAVIAYTKLKKTSGNHSVSNTSNKLQQVLKMFYSYSKSVVQWKKVPVNFFTTLVDIRAYRMFPLSSPSYVTTAFESSWIIDTGSLWVAHIWELTLVSIIAGFTIKGPPYKGRTLAAIGPWRVDTSGR